MHKLFYSAEYCWASHATDTTRKSSWIADSLKSSPIDGVEVLCPELARRDEILAVHSEQYVNAIESGQPSDLANSTGIPWCRDVYDAVLSSTGGVVAAARAASTDGVAGSLSSGLHHARQDRGSGFCTFNGLVIAARDAVRRGHRVLIMDLDAHCGGGTNSLICRDVRISQLDIAVDTFDYYPGCTVVDEPDEYLSILRRSLDRVPQDVSLVIYNAGMDVHERDCGPAGFDVRFVAAREALVFSWSRDRQIPLAYVIAGGYTTGGLRQQELVALHRCTIQAAAHSLEESVCHP